MQVFSVRINDNTWLCYGQIPRLSDAPTIRQSVHHIHVFDVSGSMSGDLPRMRQHAKATIRSLVSIGDTLTMIWFSGRGQFGIICEGARVQDAADYAAACEAIDRKLRPVGMTGFKEPLEEVGRVISRLKSLNKDSLFSLMFMSDGYDNQWKQEDILKVTRDIAPSLSSTVIVEYGWYANRALLGAMAEALGGEHSFVQNADEFLPVFDRTLSGKSGGVARREVVLPATALHGMVFAPGEDGIVTWNPDAENKVRVPSDLECVYFLSSVPVGHQSALGDPRQADPAVVTGLYAAAAVLSQRMLSDEVMSVLGALGDERLVVQFASCFGKQQYSLFRGEAVKAANTLDARWVGGYNANAIPPEDSYTVLQLLSDLSREGNLLHTGDTAWSYSPIGRKTAFGGDKLADDVREELSDAIALASRAGDLDAVKAAIEAAQASAVKEYKFTRTGEAGVPMTNLVMHESRPNINVQTVQTGLLELGADGPAHGLPERLPSKRFRNYAVVRDGILNVEMLPVSLTKDAHAILLTHGLVSQPWKEGKVYAVSVVGLPIINRRMVRAAVTGAYELFSNEWLLVKAKAAQKVFKYYEDAHAPRSRSGELEAAYGLEAAAWLKEVGVTDNGYAPKRVVEEVSDVYMGRELKVGIKSFSSPPKVEDVLERMAAVANPPVGKKAPVLTASMQVMVPFIKQVLSVIESGKNPEFVTGFLRERTKFWVSEARRLNAILSEVKFAVVVGQVWFKEFASLDEGTLEMADDEGVKYTATATLREMEVKI